MKRKIILISFLYILIGIIIFEISNGSIFQFLFENGFEVFNSITVPIILFITETAFIL